MTAAGAGARRTAARLTPPVRADTPSSDAVATSDEALDLQGLPQPGDLLAGKYRIGATLGRGGMGVVVSGMHETLRQSVAIKFLRPAYARDEDSLRRFLREARAAASLRSVHATRIFDIDCTDAGVPYIVMELLLGTSVDRVLEEQGAFTVPAAVDCLLELCDALSEAHAAGLVHRDLKPSNLFLASAPDGDPILKVLDFGISKSLASASEPGAGETSLTAPNTLLGSPQYMSPEQVRNARGVDARTDIWAIGVILYELLTRMPPFESDSIPHLYALILSAAPRPLAAIHPRVPPKLAEVAVRCLEKDPARRPADVVALAIALAPFGSRRAPEILARTLKAVDRAPGSPGSRASLAPSATAASRATARRTRVRLAVAVAVGALGLAAVGVTLSRRGDAEDADRATAGVQVGPAAPPSPVATPAATRAPVSAPAPDPVSPGGRAATAAGEAPAREERVTVAPATVGPDAGSTPAAVRPTPAPAPGRVRELKEIKLLP
jgi:serine/threonine protein kinase